MIAPSVVSAPQNISLPSSLDALAYHERVVFPLPTVFVEVCLLLAKANWILQAFALIGRFAASLRWKHERLFLEMQPFPSSSEVLDD